jgi:ADP-ribose pyrophosphatase
MSGPRFALEARRRYPSRPLVGAGAVIVRERKVLLLKRRFPPNKGMWALPGGLVELGETVQEAAVREVKEETGLEVRLERLIDVQNDLHRDAEGRLEYHYILVDYLATIIGGRLKVSEESLDHGWFARGKESRLKMSTGTMTVLKQAFMQRQF